MPEGLDALGRRFADRGIAWHWGDPLREQRSLQPGGAGLVDLSNRGVIRVTGEDRLTWMHSLTSQHVEHLAPGESALTLVLSPHGHVEHELHVVDDVDPDARTLWVTVEPGTADSLAAYLDSMRFMLRVEVDVVTDAWAVTWEPVREPVDGSPTWLTPEAWSHGFAGREVIVPRGELGTRAEGRDLAGSWAWNAVRVAAGVPRLGLETDHRTIPHEVGWIGPAVHLDKGCYRGQETVARVQNLGRPPRRLVLLHLDGSADAPLPRAGEPVELDGRAVGFVGTAVQHYELGPVALAVVKRAVPPESVVSVAGVPASVEVVVEA